MNTSPRRGKAPIVAVLAALVLVGGLAAMAAPQGHTSPGVALAQRQALTSPTATTTGAHTTAQHVAQASVSTPAATPTATATTAPQPTDTPAPPAPTATPVPPSPTPTPTATIAPTWHSVGTYSGTGPTANFATLTAVSGAVRVDWNCQLPGVGGLTSWAIGFTITDPSIAGTGEGQGTACQAGQTSGSWTFSHLWPASGADWTLSEVDRMDAGGAWSVTVYEWY